MASATWLASVRSRRGPPPGCSPATTSRTAPVRRGVRTSTRAAAVIDRDLEACQDLGTQADHLPALRGVTAARSRAAAGADGTRYSSVTSVRPTPSTARRHSATRRSRRGWSRPRDPRPPRSASARGRASAPAGARGRPCARPRAQTAAIDRADDRESKSPLLEVVDDPDLGAISDAPVSSASRKRVSTPPG